MIKYIFIGILLPSIASANSFYKSGICTESKIINFDNNTKEQIQCYSYKSNSDKPITSSELDTSIGKINLTLSKVRFDDDIISLKINDAKVDSKGQCIEAQNHFFCSISIYDQYKIKSTISINFVEEY